MERVEEYKPWEETGQIPEEWMLDNCYGFIRSKNDVIASATTSDFPGSCGVYFIVENGEILYIGKADQINHRANSHIRSRVNKFSLAWVTGIPRLFLEDVECFYIHTFCPENNNKYPIPTNVAQKMMDYAICFI